MKSNRKHPRANTLRRLQKIGAMFVGAGLLTGPVHAVDGDGNYAIWGQGSRSCNQFLKKTDDETQTRFRDYTMGYLTAYNMLSDDTYSVTGRNPLPQFIERVRLHCEGNMLDSFDRALKIVIAQQFDDRLKTPTGNVKTWGRAPGKQPATEAP